MIPKIPSTPLDGWISRQRVRCGKTNCKCSTGQHHHMASYLFFRKDGKLQKRYIRKKDVDEMLHFIRKRDERKRFEKELKERSMSHWRKLRDTLRTHRQELKKENVQPK